MDEEAGSYKRVTLQDAGIEMVEADFYIAFQYRWADSVYFEYAADVYKVLLPDGKVTTDVMRGFVDALAKQLEAQVKRLGCPPIILNMMRLDPPPIYVPSARKFVKKGKKTPPKPPLRRKKVDIL